MDKFENLEKLAKLKSDWILTEEEFAAEKKKLLDTGKDAADVPPVAPAARAEAPKAPKVPKDSRFASLPTYHEAESDAFVWKFLSAKWRIDRTQYVGRILALYVVMFPGFALNDHAGKSDLPTTLFSFLALAWMYGCFAVSAKRFHDFGTTGWAVLIPFYGFLAPLFAQGDAGDNKYGPPPS